MRRHVALVVVDPRDSELVFAATSFGLLRSTDAGARWFAADAGLKGDRVRSVAIDAGPPRVVYASTLGRGGGLFVSKDGGRSWTRAPLPRGTQSPYAFEALATVPERPGILFAATADGVIHRTHDGGRTWSTPFEGVEHTPHPAELSEPPTFDVDGDPARRLHS